MQSLLLQQPLNPPPPYNIKGINMKNPKIIKHALLKAILTALYVMIIGSLMYLANNNTSDPGPNILVPIAMLMLLVFSVALIGWLMFGKPIMLYLDKKKKEAISLLTYTLLFFMLLTLIVLAFLLIVVV